jgi:hypothetical protein
MQMARNALRYPPMKTALLAFLTSAMVLAISPAFAGKEKGGDHACCATKTAANSDLCLDYASLNLNADQKSKMEAWQAECTKAGCTKESRQAFLKQAKGILSADQYGKLKKQCDKKADAKAQA